MLDNKKLIIIVASILVVAALGVGAYLYFGQEKEPADLLVVTEPTTTPTPSPKPEIDYSDIDLPKSDNEGKDNLITEEEVPMSEEETAAIVKSEEEKGTVEMTPEQIAEANQKIEEAKKAAEANPDGIEKVVHHPIETEPVVEMPKKDADGYMYTKEEAVNNFASAYQKVIDSNSFSYSFALEEAKKRDDFTQESWDADLNQLMTDPYSSPRLAVAFDEYRRVGLLDGLIFAAAEWLATGGDDGDWGKTAVQ